jgi:hypothetical protein
MPLSSAVTVAIWLPSEVGPMKHFVGSPRRQARARIVSPHLALADYRALHPLAQRAHVDVPQAALSAAAVRCHLGRVLDIRRVSGSQAARYVSKYLVKGARHPAFVRGHARRFAMRALRAPREPGDWRYDPRPPAHVVLTEYGELIAPDTERWSYPRAPS